MKKEPSRGEKGARGMAPRERRGPGVGADAVGSPEEPTRKSARLLRIYLYVLVFAGWLNTLKLGAFGLGHNPFLWPLAAFSLGLVIVMGRERLLRWRAEGLGEDGVAPSWGKLLRRYVLALLGVWPLRDGESRLSRRARLLYAIFLLASASTLAYGFPLEREMLVRILLFFVLMVLVPSLDASPREWKGLIRLVGVLLGISGGFAFVMLLLNGQYIWNEELIGVYGKGVGGIYLNENQAGTLSAIGLILAHYLALEATRKGERAAWGFVTAMQLLVLVFCNSRTSVAALGLALLGMILFHWGSLRGENVSRRSIWRSLRPTMVVLVLFLALYFGVRPVIQETYLHDNIVFSQYDLEDFKEDTGEIDEAAMLRDAKPSADDHDLDRYFYFEGPIHPEQVLLPAGTMRKLDRLLSSRLQLAHEAILLWRTKPVLGYGFRHFYEAYSVKVNEFGRLMYGKLSSSHQIFTDLLWMGGIVGFLVGIAFVVALILAVRRCWKGLRALRGVGSGAAAEVGTGLSADVSAAGPGVGTVAGRLAMERHLAMVTGLVILFAFYQLLEVTVITSFGLSTVVFWLMVESLSRGEEAFVHVKEEGMEARGAAGRGRPDGT